MLNRSLQDPFVGIFRRQPQVLLAGGREDLDSMFYLRLVGREFLESERGTFSSSLDGDNFFVFRVPAHVRSSFELRSRGLSPQQLLRSEDKLVSFFFENRLLETILPESLKLFPALWDRLRA